MVVDVLVHALDLAKVIVLDVEIHVDIVVLVHALAGVLVDVMDVLVDAHHVLDLAHQHVLEHVDLYAQYVHHHVI